MGAPKTSKKKSESPLIDPVHFFLRLEEKMAEDSVLVVDGGDFVATAAYILRPRQPLSWLDPGVFGTLGVGGGFAVGASVVRPKSEIWLIWGDGSSAYSLSEFDTFVRNKMAPIAIIGNDASWQQIARDQTTLLGSSIGTTLLKTDYHLVAEGYGGVGLKLTKTSEIDAVLDEAKRLSKQGKPVCINVHIQKTDFREGSLSI
jgi:acetolactate synthase-like protein